jgi:23S rRNA (cytidine1920-2'-O)/16S rRNA (cytidine1409-2'-O)-methyltransferase
MAKGQRLDNLLVERGLFDSRQVAQAAIMGGAILVNGTKVTKSGTPVATDVKIEILSGFERPKYVSRGGTKLERALEVFQINLRDKVCLDVGASTGGFTDCMLKHGAKQVYSIDVGYGQLDWSLRSDGRVVVKERLNARYLDSGSFYEPGTEHASFAAIDVSFISLEKILPAVLSVLDPAHSEIVCLIKPQFEAGRNAVGKGGVVSSQDTQIDVIGKIITTAESLPLKACGLTYSPLKGPAGNIEYLLYLTTKGTGSVNLDVNECVSEAHKVLNK